MARSGRPSKCAYVWALLVCVAVLLAYTPALFSGYIWDDNDYVLNNRALRTLSGLGDVWWRIGVVPQYYPLVHTMFWFEMRFWGTHPLGFHLVNILLHAANALLFGLLLRRLRVPGAWLAAFIFALHPVCVESVAWITERKNVLSLFFYLLAALSYARFAKLDEHSADEANRKSDRRDWVWYGVALLAFICSLLSKTVTVTFPAAVLLVLWWNHGRLVWRDVLLLIPFFAVGTALALLTAWMEKHNVGAKGVDWSLSPVERTLVAGRAIWFYAEKLAWPYPLIFNYPRWSIDAKIWWQYLFPSAALALIGILWVLRQRIGRGPVTAILFFCGTLLPALGFFAVYPMVFSFVADHFQYHASLGLIALVAAAYAGVFRAFPQHVRIVQVSSAIVVGLLGLLTWNQAHAYHDFETLWKDTLAKNPRSWMAENLLGLYYFEQTPPRLDEAKLHYERALSINPDSWMVENNLGRFYYGQIPSRHGEAKRHFERALALNPHCAPAHQNIAIMLRAQKRYDDAIAHYREALRISPNFAEAHYGWGNVLMDLKRHEEAIAHFQEAMRLYPYLEQAYVNTAQCLRALDRPKEAVTWFQQVLELNPRYALAHFNLGYTLWDMGKADDAERSFQNAVWADPDFQPARNALEELQASRANTRQQQGDSNLVSPKGL